MTVTFTSFSVSELPAKLLAGIGEIVARWGYLEFQLGVVVREIAGMPKGTGRVVTIGLGLGVLCRMVSNFSSTDHWIKDKKLREDLAKLAKDIRKCAPHRNEYAHGVFGTSQVMGGSKKFVRHLMGGSVYSATPDVEEITEESLASVPGEAKELWERAQDATQKLKAAKKK